MYSVELNELRTMAQVVLDHGHAISFRLGRKYRSSSLALLNEELESLRVLTSIDEPNWQIYMADHLEMLPGVLYRIRNIAREKTLSEQFATEAADLAKAADGMRRFAVRLKRRIAEDNGIEPVNTTYFFDFAIDAPEQEVAVAQFTFEGSKLTIVEAPLIHGDMDDAHFIEEARSVLAERAEELSSELASSNAANALLPSLNIISNRFNHNRGVLTLAIAVNEFDEICMASADVLSDAHRAVLSSFSKSLWNFIGQFPEWHRYQERAASSALEAINPKEFAQSAVEWVETLEDEGLAEPEVPRLLRYLAEAVQTPRKAAKRAIYALARTIQNAFIVLLEELGRWIKAMADETRTHVTKSIAKGTALAMIAGFIGLLAPISSLPGGEWLKDAAATMRPALERILKTGFGGAD